MREWVHDQRCTPPPRLPFSLLAPRILALGAKPTSTKNTRGKIRGIDLKLFHLESPFSPPQSSFYSSSVEIQQRGYKQREEWGEGLLIEPPAIPATSLFSRKDGIGDPDHFEIKRLNRLANAGFVLDPLSNPPIMAGGPW